MTLEIVTSQDNPQKKWLSALLLCALAFLLTLFCLELIVVSGRISPLWYSTALMTVVVFRAPSRQVPLLLASCVLGTTLANLLVIGPALSNVKFAILNMVQAILGGLMLRALLDRKALLNSLGRLDTLCAGCGPDRAAAGRRSGAMDAARRRPCLAAVFLHLGNL